MQDILTTGIEVHRTGELGPAARLYQQVLDADEDNSEALHLLGVVNHQQGNHARAVELIGRALVLRPNVPVFHANLAEPYRALKQFDRAVGCCRTALRLDPNSVEAFCNLGLALQDQRYLADAVEEFRRGLSKRPNFAPLHNNLGIVLKDLGRLEEALAAFRRAVELDPNFALAQSNLAQLVLDRGQAEEALSHSQEAVRLAPNVAAMHHNLGNVLRALGRLIDARAAYLEALRLNPDLALAHAHLGLTVQMGEQSGDALPWFKQAVTLEPGNATFWAYLADFLGEHEEPEQAIPCYERALSLAPSHTDARVALGWALQEVGRLSDAAEQYRIALELNPNSPAVHLNLGGLREELGQLADAETGFREALRLQPGFAVAQARLATLRRGDLPEADLAACQERLADPQLHPGPRARLLFGLAHVLDARGDYAGAAGRLREANALTLELARGRREYSSEEHEKFIDRIVQGFNPQLFARLAGAGVQSRRPVFIFGLPRSGTTLVEQVLASHPQVHGAGELRLVRQTFEAIPSVLGRGDMPRNCVPHLDPSTVRRLGEQHLEHLRTIDGGRYERIVDKMPDNYMYAGFIAALFPHAILIHCCRDQRDVALSCWMTDFRSIRWANTVEHIAYRFAQYRRLMDHWRAVLPAPIHEIRYEEIVADLEPAARRLVAACGLDWDPACLEFHRTKRPIRTASVTQVRQPIYRRSVDRWKNYENESPELFTSLDDS
jgi:tetratricopeptide (TPR) repeat protein